MTNSLGRKNLRNATLWTATEFVLGRAANLLLIISLARLLSPEDFGTFALLSVFSGLAAALIEGGFGIALIQKHDLKDEDNSTVFWINLIISSLISILLACASSTISDFFGLEIVEQLTLIVAITVWINGLGIVQRALLVKLLAFKTLAIINLCALFVSSLSAVMLAWFGFGAFSLAAQGLVSGVITVVLLWVTGRWIPKLIFSISSAKRLFSFGGFILASTLLDVFYSKSYTFLVGKFYGLADLGQFSRAESASQLVSGLFYEPIAKVAFPAFSQMKGNRDRVRRGLKGAIKFSMLLNSAAMLTLAVVARPFVLTVFGPQWELAAQILPILVLSSLFMPLHVLNLQVLMALGRADLFFVLEVLKKVIGVLILFGSYSYGVFGVAWGLFAASIFSFAVNSWYSGILLGYGSLRQTVHVTPSLFFGLVSASAAYVAMGTIHIESEVILLLISIFSSFVTLMVIMGVSWMIGFDIAGYGSRFHCSTIAS